jgi:hypothetical protein
MACVGTEKFYKFTFWTGQVYREWGTSPRHALNRLGLGAYNPVAYEVEEIEPGAEQ